MARLTVSLSVRPSPGRIRSIISLRMDLSLRTLRFRLLAAGVLPRTRLARAACYLLGLDLLLFALQRLFGTVQGFLWDWRSADGSESSAFSPSSCFALLAFRWLKARLLWRLRNRLIVTYMFIGVIPVVLLVAMAFITLYLFAGQFANFVVTSELDSRLRSLQSANAAIANELAARVERGQPAMAESLEGLKRNDPAWSVPPDLRLEGRNSARRLYQRHAGKDSICASLLS